MTVRFELWLRDQTSPGTYLWATTLEIGAVPRQGDHVSPGPGLLPARVTAVSWELPDGLPTVFIGSFAGEKLALDASVSAASLLAACGWRRGHQVQRPAASGD